MTAVAVLADAAGNDPLARLLLERTVAWARGVAPGRTVLVSDAGGVAGDVPVLTVDASGTAARVRAVHAELGVSPGEPCLIVWPRLGRPRQDLAEAALDDLRTGCELVIGPVFDGRLYLLGLRGRLDLLDEMPEAAWDSGELIGAAVGAAAAAGLDVGLLRTERGLRRPSDVRAALADPLLDAELRALLTA